jgi:hypothetical protein
MASAPEPHQSLWAAEGNIFARGGAAESAMPEPRAEAMFATRMPVEEFIRQTGSLWKDLEQQVPKAFGLTVSTSEINSWKNSLPALAEVLELAKPAVRQCVIYLEIGLPGSSCRADALIVGLDARGHRAAVVVELKQWDGAGITVDGTNIRVGGVVRLHPSDQALGYRDYLIDLGAAFADLHAPVAGCSFLHGSLASNTSCLRAEPFSKLVGLCPLFSHDERADMAAWISSRLCAAPDSRFLSEVDANQLRVSKHLFATVAKSVRDQEEWTLLDEQKAAFNLICDLVDHDDGEKHLVLVTGGPGTGKSIVAMQLLGRLCRREIPTVHVTNSSSFTTVARSLVQVRRDRLWGSMAVEGLFRLSHITPATNMVTESAPGLLVGYNNIRG